MRLEPARLEGILAAMRRRLPVGSGGTARDGRSRGLAGQPRGGLAPKDLFALRSVADVQISPDGTRVAYSVVHNDGPGRPVCGRHHPRPAVGPQPCAAARRLRPALGARRPTARLRRSERRGHGADGVGGRRQRRALPRAGRGHQSSAALVRRVGGVGAGWPAHRLRLGDARAREAPTPTAIRW